MKFFGQHTSRECGTVPGFITKTGERDSPSRFWQRNGAELGKEFRVVTLDLRGHGNSSKILGGHTIAQYARDVREIIELLQLEELTLAGWSLGGPVRSE